MTFVSPIVSRQVTNVERLPSRKPNLRPPVVGSMLDSPASGEPATSRTFWAFFERGEIDAELELIDELDAQNHRLDGDLLGLDIDLFVQLIDLVQHRFVIADDHHVDAGEIDAADFDLIGRNIDLRGAADGDFADLGREQRRDQRLQIGGLDVVGAIDAADDAVLRLVDLDEVGRRADVEDVPLAAGDVTGRFEDRRQGRVEIDIVQAGGDGAGDAFAGQDVEAPLLADQGEHLADVFVLHLDGEVAVPFARNAGGRGSAATARQRAGPWRWPAALQQAGHLRRPQCHGRWY